jgi:D-alanyl-D-alanine carboxypeptidase/D-alanyl-D-alanine-endopeptidase (penicillin-binding protein 4)
MTDVASKAVGGSRRRSKEGLSSTVFDCLRLLALLCVASPAATQSLPKRLNAILDAAPLDRHFWGIAVADTTGRTLYTRNADKLFIPASNTKLAVSVAAAVLLPPDLTVRTSVYGTGPIANGVLQGNLVLYGRGDPSMSRRCYDVDTTRTGACMDDPFSPLRELAHGLKGRGLTTVSGDLVGDGSWFEPVTLHPSWEHYDLAWWYAAPVSGLGFTDNSLELLAVPTTPDAPAALALWPELSYLRLENRTRTVPEGGRRTLDVMRDLAADRLVVWGDVPVEARPRAEYVAVSDPNLYTALALRKVMAEEGIAVLGTTRSTTDSMLFQFARRGAPLAEVESRPVRDWIFPVLNTSQNWYAEMLLKQLGKQLTGVGSWDSGRSVIQRFLIDSVGIDSTQVALSDGSGLAANNLITPAAFVQVLSWIRNHPRYEVFAAGLPRSGQPGSLRNRFLGTPLEGSVVAKTGSISRVNTLSGFVERPGRRTLVFSIQANHHVLGGRSMIAAIDSVLVEIAK